jgi:hypothetical protein
MMQPGPATLSCSLVIRCPRTQASCTTSLLLRYQYHSYFAFYDDCFKITVSAPCEVGLDETDINSGHLKQSFPIQ